MTPDPGGAKVAKPDNPVSWNLYAYVKGDPVNLNDPAGLFDKSGDADFCDVFPDDPHCIEPAPIAPSAPPGPVYTWTLDVGYTTKINLGGGLNSYDHLFIWIHPTGDNNPADGEVFDGGPTQSCNVLLKCGNDTAWVSSTGHYGELSNPSAVDFFSTQLGSSDNSYASYVYGELLSDTRLLVLNQDSHPYSPQFGPNSNSVVYSELNDLGINIPISSYTLPLLGSVGVLNYSVNGQAQLFTGWGQNLLP
jgi:hypothetical protein